MGRTKDHRGDRIGDPGVARTVDLPECDVGELPDLE